MLTTEQKEIVQKARDRIADPQHWCRHSNARTLWGFRCDPTGPRAVAFCAFGALLRECSEQYGADQWNASAIAAGFASCLAPQGLKSINDGPDGHRKVLALFDKALAE
jgi:hypothetical protein